MATTRLETRLTATDQTGRAFRSLQTSLVSVDRAITNVAKVATGLGLVFGGIFARDLLRVNKSFQSLQASLITFTGSVEKSKTVFGLLQEFAQKTPFSLEEVVGAFNTLLGQGIKPTGKQLIAFADIAGGTSKSISQFAEAAVKATVGEFEGLKSFGILARKEGDKVILSMGDLKMEVDNDAASITAALAKIGETKFAGGAERQAQTLGGSFTNLRDSLDSFMFSIGEAGLSSAISSAATAMGGLINNNQSLAQSISAVLTKAFQYLVVILKSVVDNINVIGNAFAFAFGYWVVKRIFLVTSAIYSFVKMIVTSKIALTLFTEVVALGRKGLIGLAAGGVAAATAYGAFSEQIKEVINKLTDSNVIGGAIDSVMGKLGLSIGDVDEKFKKLMDDMKKTNDLAPKFVNGITEAIGETKGKIEETFGEGVLRGVKEFYKSIGTSADSAARLTQQSLDAMRDSLSDFFMTGKFGVQDLLNSVRRAIADFMADSLTRNIKSLFSKLFDFDWMKVILGTPSAGGSTTPSPPAAGKSTGGIIRGPGGPMADAIPSMLSNGEYVIRASSVDRFGKGFFDKLNSGIMPQTAGVGARGAMPSSSGGGVIVNQTLNIETGVSQTVRAEIMNLMPQIRESTKAAVLDARRRGGQFAAAFS